MPYSSEYKIQYGFIYYIVFNLKVRSVKSEVRLSVKYVF